VCASVFPFSEGRRPAAPVSKRRSSARDVRVCVYALWLAETIERNRSQRSVDTNDAMDSELVVVCAVQVAVLAVVVAAIVVYLLRHLMFRRRHDVAGKTVLITGCDSGLGWDVARHCDRLGLRVLAGCAHPAGEGAVRLQAEASPRLHILPLDVADAQSLQAAAKTIRNQMLASEKGASSSLLHPVCRNGALHSIDPLVP